MRLIGIFALLFFSINAQANRAMYVDDFAAILDDATEKIALLTYAQSHEIDYLILYELHLVHNNHDLTNAVTNQILADFLSDAKQNYGIQKIAAAGENAWFFEHRIIAYNDSRTQVDEKFDVLGMEFEFWTPLFTDPGGYYCVNYLTPNGHSCNNSGAYDFCKGELIQMSTLAAASSHPMTVEMYVGWPTETQLVEIAGIVDKTLIHAYVPDPNNAFTYALTRLEYYANFAGIHPVSIIYSAEPNFSGPWLNSHSMEAAEQEFMSDYNAASGTWKSKVDLQEFTYFTYTMMGNIALPVELIKLQVVRSSQGSFLEWEVGLENDLERYEIEMGKDLQSFISIGQQQATGESIYRFKLPTNSSQNSFLRLKMVDKNGDKNYSSMISWRQKERFNESIYPNPVQDVLHLSASFLDKDIRIFDAQGALQLEAFLNNATIDISFLPKGIYFLRSGILNQCFVKH